MRRLLSIGSFLVTFTLIGCEGGGETGTVADQDEMAAYFAENPEAAEAPDLEEVDVSDE